MPLYKRIYSPGELQFITTSTDRRAPPFRFLQNRLPSEAVKKSTSPVILSEAKNLQLFVFKKINADASLRSESVTFFNLAEKWH